MLINHANQHLLSQRLALLLINISCWSTTIRLLIMHLLGDVDQPCLSTFVPTMLFNISRVHEHVKCQLSMTTLPISYTVMLINHTDQYLFWQYCSREFMLLIKQCCRTTILPIRCTGSTFILAMLFKKSSYWSTFKCWSTILMFLLWFFS